MCGKLFRFKEEKHIQDRHIRNAQIKAKELRVITSDGENLGVISTQQALEEARKRELDLLLVVPNANPPVAKIVDFSKFLYEERKKTSATKAKSKKTDLKEFRLGPTTGEGDIQRFLTRSREFLGEGDKVKITVKMKGRERMYPDVAFEKIKRFEKELSDVAKVEMPAKLMGNIVSTTFMAK